MSEIRFVLSFCHVNYTDGGVLPVKEICDMAHAGGAHHRRRGAAAGHDEAQSARARVRHAGPFHKWMLSSMHTGMHIMVTAAQVDTFLGAVEEIARA